MIWMVPGIFILFLNMFIDDFDTLLIGAEINT
ncbi:hypothetical protein SAMN04488577_3246 [Bacillus sp. cl95]|nr:hypothetical protein SAMN02799634_104268 [Bacillus sp. UNCCL13]SFQ88566.1 hypothetical protein SAMN04488577_3246 [Bacillus sp. cl95]